MKKGTDRFFQRLVFDKSVPSKRVIGNLLMLYYLEYPFKVFRSKGNSVFEIDFPNEYCWLLFKQITETGAIDPILTYFKSRYK